MKRLGGVSILMCVLGSSMSCAAGHAWDDPKLPPERRAELLNHELTLDERIALVHGIMALPMGNVTLPPEAIPAAGYIPGIPKCSPPPESPREVA